MKRAPSGCEKVYPGDKWFIAYGNLVGEKGVSMKVEETQSGPGSVFSPIRKKLLGTVAKAFRDVHGTIPASLTRTDSLFLATPLEQ